MSRIIELAKRLIESEGDITFKEIPLRSYLNELIKMECGIHRIDFPIWDNTLCFTLYKHDGVYYERLKEKLKKEFFVVSHETKHKISFKFIYYENLEEIKFNEKFYEPIKEGKKKATTRLKCKIKQREYFKIKFNNNTILAYCKSIECKPFKNLSLKDATLEGYNNVEMLQAELKDIYKDIFHHSEVYVIHFEILGEIPPVTQLWNPSDIEEIILSPHKDLYNFYNVKITFSQSCNCMDASLYEELDRAIYRSCPDNNGLSEDQFVLEKMKERVNDLLKRGLIHED